MTTIMTNAQTDDRLREAPTGGNHPDDTRHEDVPMTQTTQEPRIRNGVNVDTLYREFSQSKSPPDVLGLLGRMAEVERSRRT